MLPSLQVTLVLILSIIYVDAKKPPGYVKPPEIPDSNPPKYEYGYNIADEKGTGQGKTEARDGIYALGRYYVQNSNSNQNVQYFADDWGYHPIVEYSNAGPHSRARAQFALGEEAVKQLKNKGNSSPKEEITQNIEKISQQSRQSSPNIVVQQPQLIIQQQQQPQQVFVQQEQPQQPQQVFVQQEQQQPQQVFVQQEHPQQVQLHQGQPQVLIHQTQPQESVQENLVYQPQGQLTVQNNVVHSQQVQPYKQQLNEIQVIQNQQNQYETAALYENSNNKIVSSDTDDVTLTSENSGNFGSRINIIHNTVHHTPSKLIETTRNLISGQDVLNINQAVSEDQEQNIETNTAHSIISEYGNSQTLKSEEGVVTKVQINHSDGGRSFSSTTAAPQLTQNLIKEPIVVADSEENVKSTTEKYIAVKEDTKEEFYSTTGNTIETVSTNSFSVTEPSTVLVTPRPVSTTFLAPITAGVQLQSVEQSEIETKLSKNNNYIVQVQKSIPVYLGKYEYVQSPSRSHQQITIKHEDHLHNVKSNAIENIELGKTLLYFPESQQPKAQPLIQELPSTNSNQKFTENNHLTIQKLPSNIIKENFVEVDQQQAQGYQHQVAAHQHPIYFEQIVEKPVPYPVVQTQIVEKPIEVTKYVKEQIAVPVHVPIEIPYPVEKQVPIPVEVEKIVERPIHITKIVEKPIPQPYPVEKIVEKPIHVPIEVTKYIDRPYPVEVRVPHPVPYPVEKIVQKIVKQPYPVEVRVPVEVPVPHPVPVEKIIEKKVPVPQYIEKQVPVSLAQAYVLPYTLDLSKYISKPHAVHQKIVNFKIPSYLQSLTLGQQKYVTKSHGHHEQHTQQSQQLGYYYSNPYAYAPQINQYLPPKQEITITKGYLPPKQAALTKDYLPPTQDCDQHYVSSHKNTYYTIKSDDYIGLLPPKFESSSSSLRNYPRKYRTARSNFENNLRLEYGFMPPLIPSLEIDENGKPIEKDGNK